MSIAVPAPRSGSNDPSRRYTLARIALSALRLRVELHLYHSTLDGQCADSVAFGALTANGYHVETYTGGYVDISAPDPTDIRLVDVAHGLSQICRGAGQTARFFSVAEHALIVSRRLRELGHPPPVVFAGLHHDDPEAYLHDVTKPLKQLIGEPYGGLETEMWEAIRAGLDLGDCDITDKAIKKADTWALGAENHYLRRSRGRTWFCYGVYSPRTHPMVLGLAPEDAEALWLAEHARLLGELGASC
jgi:uncharacterized protein